MKQKRPFSILLGWLALGLATTHEVRAADVAATSAAHSTGDITGRVQNAVTGQYLSKARVAIKGTEQVVLTDEFGTYRFSDVRSGPVVLQVFYTDLDGAEVSLDLPAGATLERNIELTSVARYGQNASIVKLDPFLVASNKETDAEAIATNEQRFAPNIKNVIATDALGDLSGASAGDFLKHLPGLVAEYENAEIIGISIRGVGSAMTAVQINGAPTVTSGIASGGFNRQVNLLPQAMNNLSRVEVTKVPTPSSPADALAGTVNLISKSAFERSGAELRFGLNVTANSKALHLEPTPHAYHDNETYKVLPGFDFDYTLPLGKNFGIVLTAVSSPRFNPQDVLRTIWNAAGTSTGASLSLPYMQSSGVTTSGRHYEKSSYGIKADWRIAPNSVLSVGGQLMQSGTMIAGHTLTLNAGTIGTPTPATGTPMSFGPDFTAGATGRGALSLVATRQTHKLTGRVVDLNYRFDDGKWKVSSALNYGDSESWLNPGSEGAFSTLAAANLAPVRVSLGSVAPGGTAQVFNNTNQAVDIYNANSYRMTTARRNIRRFLAITRFGRVDVGRRLDVFPFPFTVQVGGLLRTDSRDRNEEDRNWTFAGTTHSPLPYLSQVYVNQGAHSGFGSFPPISGHRAWAAFKADPSILSQTLAQQVAQENIRLGNSEFAEETVTSYYVQGEARLLNNRLNVLGGVRHEDTGIYAQGALLDPNAVFVRNPDGTFAHSAQGARIRRPDAGAAGSVAEAQLIRKERGYIANRNYGGFYPSLHLTFNARENFLLRLAYARTYGRPDFPDIVPNSMINEADLDPSQLGDPSVIKGTIMVRNTGLKPWTAHNYDFSAEYYTEQGGVLSAGVFVKEISDFFGTDVRIATAADLAEVGLDPQYVGWNLTSKFNSGSARVRGAELDLRQSLRALGGWGRHFTVFANATKLELDGNPHGSFESFVPKTANWGFTFKWKRLTLMPKWNHRGLNKQIAQPAMGPDAFLYIKARTMLDINVAYQLTRHLSLSGSANNVMNAELTNLIYGSQTPAYAWRSNVGEYGVMFSLSLKGKF